MENSKPTQILLTTWIRMKRDKMKGIRYAPVVGSLMYAMISTRSDPAYVVGVLSHYMVNPKKRHWEAVKHIL